MEPEIIELLLKKGWIKEDIKDKKKIYKITKNREKDLEILKSSN